MERTAVRLLLFSAPLVFAFQCWVRSEYGEPYPALILPAFGGVPDSTTYESATVVLLRDGKELSRHSVYELLPDLPRANQYAVGLNRLRYDSRDPDAKRWAMRLAARLNPQADQLLVRWERRSFPPHTTAPQWLGDFSAP